MAQRSIADLGSLQRRVMEIVWKLGEATVQEVRQQLKRRPSPAYTTVLSVMQKLEKARWLKHRAEGRTYVYRASRSREQEGDSTLKSFVDGVFRGDRLLLFEHLLRDDSLGEDELLKLRRMIDAQRKEQRDDR